MLLYKNDLVQYRTPGGAVRTGRVLSVSGDRIHLQNGSVIYKKYVIRKREEEINEQ